MSCKYCASDEPLINESGIDISIKQNNTSVYQLKFTKENYTLEKTIYFCPICGDSLKPFGPAWMHN